MSHEEEVLVLQSDNHNPNGSSASVQTTQYNPEYKGDYFPDSQQSLVGSKASFLAILLGAVRRGEAKEISELLLIEDKTQQQQRIDIIIKYSSLIYDTALEEYFNGFAEQSESKKSRSIDVIRTLVAYGVKKPDAVMKKISQHFKGNVDNHIEASSTIDSQCDQEASVHGIIQLFERSEDIKTYCSILSYHKSLNTDFHRLYKRNNKP